MIETSNWENDPKKCIIGWSPNKGHPLWHIQTASSVAIIFRSVCNLTRDFKRVLRVNNQFGFKLWLPAWRLIKLAIWLKLNSFLFVSFHNLKHKGSKSGEKWEWKNAHRFLRHSSCCTLWFIATVSHYKCRIPLNSKDCFFERKKILHATQGYKET